MAIGIVVFVSRNGGMIVVQHDQGFTLIELLGAEGEIGRGDRVRGDLMSLGGEEFYKDGDAYDCVVQNIYDRASRPSWRPARWAAVRWQTLGAFAT